MSRQNLLSELTQALRNEGLDAQLTADDDTLTVGTSRRGPRAEAARVYIRETDADEYLDGLGAEWDGDDPAEYAFGMLVMLLVEALSTTHDGVNNMVTEVELRRGLHGRLGLHETRIESGTDLGHPGEMYGWSPDRP